MIVFKGTVIEDSPAALLNRVRLFDTGEYIQQAEIDSISVEVFNLQTAEQVGETFTLDVTESVFDTLQTDARWTEDDTGYNFLAVIPSDYFPSGGQTYRVEITVTPVSEYGLEMPPILWDLKCIEKYSL